MFIDTHCHLHDRSSYDFALQRQGHSDPADFTPERILERCKNNNVFKVICIGTDPADSLAARDFAASHENVFWSYGVHPDEAGQNLAAPDLADLKTAVAIGEIGLDYRDGDKNREAQIKLLEAQLDLSKKLDLPCIFHVREAFSDFWPILDNQHIASAVVHSFSDSSENLKKSLEHGFFIGVNGLATFAKLDCFKDPAALPLDRALLETDAPFLTPVPNRGQVNDSSNIPHVAAWLAAQKGLSLEEVANATTKNTESLFKI